MRLDLTNVSSGFEPLPVGVYEVCISKCELTQAKSSGNDMFKITATVQDGEFAGRCIFDNVVLIESCHWKIKQVCDAIGMDTDSDEIDIEAEDFVGQYATVEVDVETREYNGSTKVQNVVKKWIKE